MRSSAGGPVSAARSSSASAVTVPAWRRTATNLARSPGAVRDFRGAMAGRGDKGLLITAGTFTADAKKEATRDGAPPVDLIDGDRLCDLLKRYALGVRTATRTVEDVSIDRAFFGEI